MNLSELSFFIQQQWDKDILPRLVEYVKIPAKSPAFDPSWSAHGHLDQVITMARDWARNFPSQIAGQNALTGLTLEVISIEGKTPCIYFDLPATQGLGSDQTILFYGHLDKQPEMSGWREGLGPWKPVIEDDKLYGRGSADDGYALFASLTAIAAVDLQSAARPRCVGLIETCEESGSFDLPAYLELLSPRLGDVKLVIGLDSGCGNYEQLWVTTSLRGLIGGVLSVEILEEGVHSGMASGIVPSSFRIARKLLNRIDDVESGRVLSEVFHAQVPSERMQQAKDAGNILGDSVWSTFPWVGCSHEPGLARGTSAFQAGASTAGLYAMPTTTDPVEAILARTWRPALSVTGAAGLPQPDEAGNVLRPRTALKLSMRLPPTVDGERASAHLKKLLEDNPPYNARVSFKSDWAATGWNAPPTAPWLASLLEDCSQQHFSRSAAYIGEGGTIPFMNMLGSYFPNAQFLITGVLGPKSNAHGPNEFLHIPYVKKLTQAVASVVAGLANTPNNVA
jgi:acetylornithine deacetylase/succinyl-diaminopimelate desuccinylase-like protein